MSYRKTLSRLTIASLAAAAVAAPAATAMPTEPTSGATKSAAQADMHASTVKPPAATHQDQRGEAAAGRSEPPVTPRHPVGMPTWPEHPQPIGRAPAQPPVSVGGGEDDDVPTLALVIAGALLIAGGMAATAMRLRTRTAH